MEIVYLKSKVKLSEKLSNDSTLPLHKDADYIKNLKVKFISLHNKTLKKKEVQNGSKNCSGSRSFGVANG